MRFFLFSVKRYPALDVDMMGRRSNFLRYLESRFSIGQKKIRQEIVDSLTNGKKGNRIVEGVLVGEWDSTSARLGDPLG